MLFWEEEREEAAPYQVPDDVLDVGYQVDCRTLPLDHAWALARAVSEALPWFEEEPEAGLHLIHGAESGNGWYRPEDVEHEVLHLPRRTRLYLRLPKTRIPEATEGLVGRTFDIDGHPLRIVRQASQRRFSPLSTLFSRHVLTREGIEEREFLQWAADALRALGIPVRKMMSGRTHAFRTPEGPLFTRTLMVADLEPEQAVELQRHGLGEGRKMGFGLFLPHKGIRPVKEGR
ncbi:MAG: type I-MYXAN CRISPR-associated protein Cas6/Cmx6 [Gammaproteobacteria bacterium]|nr:MAG: type I-MYXAN CRISPR-associated protein Cas6/Cmx6 [Gammaproteobacteria bacterium]